jgi:histidine triad (HIT) family protein
MMSKNIFLDIIQRRLPADIVYEDDDCVAFRDIHPQAPTHILVVPRKEIRLHSEITHDDKGLIGHLNWVVGEVARKEGLEHYRVVVNNGEGAGQTVPHLHLHLLGGRDMTWPPG